MNNLFIPQVFWEHGMCNIQQGVNIYHLLRQVLFCGVEGDVVELGIGFGHTSVIMQKTLVQFGSDKKLVLFDSCKGLPPLTEGDGNCPFREGGMPTTKQIVFDTFDRYKTTRPEIVEGWFKDTLESLPNKVAFAHLDGDLYESTKIGLKHLYERLPEGGIIVIDDYYDAEVHPEIVKQYNRNLYNQKYSRKYEITDYCPGVKKACDEFFADKPEKVSVLVAADEKHGFIRKE